MLSFYNLLIIFLIITFVHKTVALVILLNIPLYNVRLFFNIVEPLFLLCFLLFYNLNVYIKTILLLLFIAPLRYWLLEEDKIYYFVNNNDYNNKIINSVKIYSGIPINILDWIFIVGSLYYIFMPSSHK
jgi:hypothetical protein